MRAAITLLLAAMFALACGRSHVEPAPRPVELCTLTSNPAGFDGQFVQVRASVLADGHHGAVLLDEQCRERGLALAYAEGARDTASLRRLDDAIFRTGLRGTLDKEITGTFIGTFRWDPPRWWQRGRAPRRPWRVLEVSDIAEMRVKAKPLPTRVPLN